MNVDAENAEIEIGKRKERKEKSVRLDLHLRSIFFARTESEWRERETCIFSPTDYRLLNLDQEKKCFLLFA